MRAVLKHKLAPSSFEIISFLKRRFLEIWGFLFIIMAGCIGCMIWSYDPYDPSFNTAIEGPVQNWMGELGAYGADLLYQTMGIGAYGLSLMGLAYGLTRLYHGPSRSVILRSLGFLCFMPSLCWLLILLSQKGGALGHLMHQLSSSFIVPRPLKIFINLGLCLLTAPWAFHTPKGIFKYLKKGVYTGARLIGWILQSLYKLGAQGALTLKEKQHKYKQYQEPALPALNTIKIEPKQEQGNGEREPSPSQTAFSVKIALKEKQKISSSKQSPRKVVNLADQEKYQLPPLELLSHTPMCTVERESETVLTARAYELKRVLDDFSVKGEITKVRPGPVVTLFELVPAPGVKASRIIGLADDIARSMCAVSARIAVIPGKNALGIELPNSLRETVLLKELLACKEFDTTHTKLSLVLGKDIGGAAVIADLARMPHLLVAGTTGAGKSVAINTMILSLLYRLPPEKCRFIMIDPKMLELSVYNGIPHLLSPVVTEPKKAIYALKWTVREMEDRYRAMSRLGVRNIEGYNQRLAEAKQRGEILSRQVQTGFDPQTGEPIYETQDLDTTALPYIVVVVDEMADLMMVAGKEIEAAVQRLAQMARAAGIHLIMATQRPSVDVITGTIKANFPTRISFQVTSKFDSRTILGEQGAEQLLGRGDMLFMEPGGKIQRVHGPFVSDEEVQEVVAFLKSQGQPQYVESITDESSEGTLDVYGDNDDNKGDQLYRQAVDIVTREGKASTSFIQRHLQIGYNRAARIIEQMENEGVISPANHVGKREVLQRAS